MESIYYRKGFYDIKFKLRDAIFRNSFLEKRPSINWI
jgi:hypothetical protein